MVEIPAVGPWVVPRSLFFKFIRPHWLSVAARGTFLDRVESFVVVYIFPTCDVGSTWALSSPSRD